ncbi:MAG: phosphonate ABC transporter, permease protein PhnE [Candidatus Sericytochromatia bacterium]|nr:phosphonate ABC transporter, permease protein PhnE [Candidatus Sericytochromatia bacterium]
MAKSLPPTAEPSGTQVLRLAPTPPDHRVRWIVSVLMAVLVLGWAFSGARFQPRELYEGRAAILDMFQRMMPPDFSQVTSIAAYNFPPEIGATDTLIPVPLSPGLSEVRHRWWENTFPQTIVGGTIQTIQIALAGTFLALVMAFPLSFLAARNTTPHQGVYLAVRSVLNFLRSIPDLALGLMFISAVGLGAFAGTLAVTVSTTTILAKLISEKIEGIDGGVVEALQTTGANHAQVLMWAVVPQILPDIVGLFLYRFESNIRAAAVLGLIGAGGIGQLMNNAFRQFQYREAAAIVLVLIVLVMTVDFFSARVRKLTI